MRRVMEDVGLAYSHVEECLVFSNKNDPGPRVNELAVGRAYHVDKEGRRTASEGCVRAASMVSEQQRSQCVANIPRFIHEPLLIATDMPYERLAEAFRRTDIGDGREFSQYLQSTVFSQVIDTDDLDDEAYEDFSKNVLYLVKLLGKPNKPSTDLRYFHAHVLLAVQTFRPERWCDDNDVVIYNMGKITELALECFKRGSKVPNAQPRASSRYWNCARARRELWKTWQAIRCDDFEWGYLGGAGGAEGDGDCWHLQCRDMMEAIQRQALAEVHSNVLLAVGTKLPKELADQVLELAMAAEECPMDPHICTAKANENNTTYTEGHFGEYRFTRSDQPCTCELRSRTSFGAAPARLRAK